MITAGIDAGSRAIKIVVVQGESFQVLARGVREQGPRQDVLVGDLFEGLLRDQGLKRSDVARVVATGYGRHRVDFADTAITEIACHARGVRHVLPEARTVIDIGGQDSKIIRLDPEGHVRDFSMNERCAAGTGRFLEVVADRMGVAVEQLGEMARRSRKPCAISDTCVVFAESEIIGLLAGNEAPEDIVAGVEQAIASRLASMAGRALEEPAVFTGGVAMVSGMDGALNRALGCTVRIAPDPRFTGALGAAILAAFPGAM